MNKYAIGTIVGAAVIAGVKKVGSSAKRLHRNRYAELLFSSSIDAKGLTDSVQENLLALDFVAKVEFDENEPNMLRITSIHLDPRNPIELQIPTYCEQIAQVLKGAGIDGLFIPFLDESHVDLEEWLENNEEFNFMLSKKITGDPFKDNNYRIPYGAEYHGDLLDGVFLDINGYEIIIEGYETSEFWFYDEHGNKFMTSKDITPKIRKR